MTSMTDVLQKYVTFEKHLQKSKYTSNQNVH